MAYRKGTREDKKPVPWNTDDDDFDQLEYIRYYPLPVPPRASSENPSVSEMDYDCYQRGNSGLLDYVMEQVSTEENNQLSILESSELTQKTSKGAGEGLHIGGSNLDAKKEKTNQFPISGKRESSEDTNEGDVHDSAGDLDSDAEKEVNQPIISLPKRKRTKQEIVASVQAWQKGEDVAASVGEYVTKLEKNIPTSSPSVLAGFSSDDLSTAQIQYELCGREAGSLENFVRMQQQSYSSHQAVEEPSDSDNEQEEMDPMPVGELIFELNLTYSDHLVIPYMPTSRYFPKLLERKPMTDEILHLSDRNERHWFMDLTYDVKIQSYVITNGLSLYLDHYYLNPPDVIQVYVPADGQRHHDNHFNIKHKKLLGRSLFVVNVLRSNKLTIPCNLEVVNLFSPQKPLPPPEHLREFPLKLIDHRDTIWEMRFIFFEDEEAYVVYRGWEDYVARYGLNYKDSVRFFEWKNNTQKNSFVIFHEPGPGPEARDNSSPPMFVKMNYVCGLELTAADVEFNRLEMLGIQITFLCRGREMVKLIDKNNKIWYVIILQIANHGGYVIEDGWDAIVREHELREGDEVKLYTPVGADHDKHFLIQLTKKPRVETVTKSLETGSGSWKGKEKM